MADVGGTSTTLSDVLKRLYLPKVRDQLNNEILVQQILSLNTEDIEGLEAVLALHYSRSKGVGARRELADLPDAGVQKYKQATYDLAYLYGKIMVSGPAIIRTRTDAGSWIRAMRSELDRIRDDLALDFARQIYGNGDGVIATVSAAASGGTGNPDVITLTSAEALVKGYLYPGFVMDVGSVGTPTAHGNSLEIVDVDPDLATVYIAEGTFGSIANGDKIFREDANDADGTAEMTAGIQSLVSTTPSTQTDVGGISSVTSRFWRNIAEDASDAPDSGALSLDLLMKIFNKANAAGAKASDLTVLTTPGQVRNLFASDDFAGKVQFVNTTALKGGFSNITFDAGQGAIQVQADRLAPWGKVFFIDTQHVEFFSPGDWDFLSRDGLTIKWVDNKDAFQSVLFKYANMGTDRRNTSAVIFGLTETAGV